MNLKELLEASMTISGLDINDFPPYVGEDITNIIRDKSFDKAPIVTIPIKSLVATQKTVDRDKVEGIIRAGNKQRDLPRVIKKEGKYYVYDGTNRIMARKLMDKKHVKVRLVDVDTITQDQKSLYPMISWDESQKHFNIALGAWENQRYIVHEPQAQAFREASQKLLGTNWQKRNKFLLHQDREVLKRLKKLIKQYAKHEL